MCVCVCFRSVAIAYIPRSRLRVQNLNLNEAVYYFTNKSFIVPHSDWSQESLESSSSSLSNQKLDDDWDVDALDFRLGEVLLLLLLVALAFALLRKFSMAVPRIVASTKAALSQRNRALGFWRGLLSSLSFNRSMTSRENDTVALAVLRSDFLRANGVWDVCLSNQLLMDGEPLSADELHPVTICCTFCIIVTSKLFLRLVDGPLSASESGAKWWLV